MPEQITCPLCHEGRAAPLPSPEGIPLFRCVCGLVFQHPPPPEEELAALYTSDYYASWDDLEGTSEAVRRMKRASFRFALAGLPAGTKAGRVLDVGCATGFFLEEARNLGWDPWGVELSPHSAGVAARTFGDRIRQGTLEQAGFDDGSFELVTMFDFLEHVTAPREILTEAGRILTNQGLLLVVTPDMGSVSARLMGRGWSHIKREHLWYFTRSTLETLMAGAGFRMLSCHAATKYLSLDYIARQFEGYRHPLLTPLSAAVSRVLTDSLRKRAIPFRCGEMVVLAGKVSR